MTPVRYRWDVYGSRKTPTEWRAIKSQAMLNRALRALIMPQERIRIEYDNGQQVVIRRK